LKRGGQGWYTELMRGYPAFLERLNMDALIQTINSVDIQACSIAQCKEIATHLISKDNETKYYCFSHASNEWQSLLEEKSRSRFISSQPNPVPNDEPSIQDLVVKDIQDYKEYGIKKYGMVLQAHNGRDPIIDAYQECLAQAQYLRQYLREKYGE